MDAPDRAIEYIISASKKYAIGKSNRVYCEEFRKTIKAKLMKQAEVAGHKTTAAQEREAYAAEEYQSHLLALQESVRIEEELKFMIIAAQARVDVWRASTYANSKIDKALS